MCSQPPKKTHVDRFSWFREACVLAPENMVIGISGGEPTLYKQDLLNLIEATLDARPDLSFHVLSNGQHFDASDVERLRHPAFRRVTWGIPLYSSDAEEHDRIVGKTGAFERLERSFVTLLRAGARIELRTVLLRSNVGRLDELARHISVRLGFIEIWSIMQLENIGFARNRWPELYFDHAVDFEPVGKALEIASVTGTPVQLFNFPLCTVPSNLRHLAPPSISDWKRKYAKACDACRARESCSGFFEWHPEAGSMERVRPL
jgi:His-Xaa-Ser system radical SAM maturase HxsC